MTGATARATAEPTRLAFPREEYEQRVLRFQRWLTEHDVPHALVTQPEHYTWLAGYEPTSIFYHQALAVTAEPGSDPTLLYNRAEQALALETCWVEDTEAVWTHEDQLERTLALLRRRGFRDGQRLGMSLGAYNTKPAFVLALKEALPNTELVDVSGPLDELRLVKSEREVTYLREAAWLADVGMRAGFSAARAGATDRDLLGAIQNAVTVAGGEFCAYPGIVDARASLHGTAIGKRLEPGDVVMIEVTGVARRYHCNEVRTLVIQEPSERVLELHSRVVSAHERVLDLLRPGTSAEDVVAASQDALGEYADANWGRYGFGMELSYPPIWLGALSLMKGDPHVLEPNIVLTLETGILAEEGAFLLGTNVHVTDGDPVILNDLPYDLHVTPE